MLEGEVSVAPVDDDEEGEALGLVVIETGNY